MSVLESNHIIRWGIIGAGNVAEVKSGPGFYKAPNSQLTAVMRRDAEKSRDFAQRHNVPLWYTDANALLANPDIDAVYIATPPAQHKDYALAALAAGKHVYIEKPVTLNAAECDELIAAEQQSTHKICVAHYRRFLPCFVRFHQLLQEGAIGKPLLARIDLLRYTDDKPDPNNVWRIDPAQSGGGIFHDLAPHQLDLLLHWFGPLHAAQGTSTNQAGLYKADDCVLGWAQFESGMMLQGRWHFAVAKSDYKDTFEVIGTEGNLTIDFFGEPVITLKNLRGEQQFVVPHPQHFQQPLIEQVNAYYRGERNNPNPLSEARQVMALMDRFTQKTESHVI